MNCLPLDIVRIIKTYKKDLELLELQPKPGISQYCKNNNICCYDRFITDRLLELLYSRVPLSEVRQCIKCLLRVPASIFIDYNSACEIFKLRCELWNINPKTLDLGFWAESLPTIMNQFLDTGDIGNLYSQINNCLSEEHLRSLRLTEAW